MTSDPLKLEFEGSQGAQLAARLDNPEGTPTAYALFAHCFTCSKDLSAARRIAAALTKNGIAVLRFDFTGLGNSGGDFASTNFSSNLQDLVLAANYLRTHLQAPRLMVGHSLGGAAVLAAASQVPEVKAVATIGAPASAGHVVHNFGASLREIKEKGEATVHLGERPFKIKRQFVEDLESQDVQSRVALLNKAVLILHSPVDETVGIDNAAQIFQAAKHPKSFVSLDDADHLLYKYKDADYAAQVIAAWTSRYIKD
ncbi:Alpha/beta hydrolase family protein [Pseudovibrio axinellae]|uniref:Alpha/beta hydrolase family protein n=1 Tax=Pseudovibrio axinellae TaxID=989403 RepID=A0A166AFE6_9HYPH|nr:Alpha/beta hydrolase family protein [Pseudovibrio axinellae]SEP79678.1 putative redox protein [Pseudovibrio axinellae]